MATGRRVGGWEVVRPFLDKGEVKDVIKADIQKAIEACAHEKPSKPTRFTRKTAAKLQEKAAAAATSTADEPSGAPEPSSMNTEVSDAPRAGPYMCRPAPMLKQASD